MQTSGRTENKWGFESSRVKNGFHPAWPDPTRPEPNRPKPSPFLLSLAIIVPCNVSLRFTEWTPVKDWWQQQQLNLSSTYRYMLNSLGYITSFQQILFKVQFQLGLPGLAHDLARQSK